MKYKDTETGEILKIKRIKDAGGIDLSFRDKNSQETRLDGPSNFIINSRGELSYYYYNVNGNAERLDGPTLIQNNTKEPFCMFVFGYYKDGLTLGSFEYNTGKFERGNVFK